MKRGDTVLILAESPPGLSYLLIPNGTIGTVLNVRENDVHVSYNVNGQHFSFSFFLKDMVDASYGVPVMKPDMELEEIEMAEELMRGLP